MMTNLQPPKSVLRRRQSLSADAGALIDGISVIGLSYFLSYHYAGAFRVPDLLLLLSLLAAMTVVYDKIGIYRRYGGPVKKIVSLAQAWGLSLATVVIIGFATGALNHFSRAHIGALLVSGFVIQLAFHVGMDLFQRRLSRFAAKKKAIIVGDGFLAHYISKRINSNPWMPETVVGALTLPSESSGVADNYDTAQLPVLGTIDDIDFVLDARDIKGVYLIATPDASEILQKLCFTLIDRSIDIHWIPDLSSLSPINLNVKELAGTPVITLSESPLSGWAFVVKSIEDKLIASLALILSAPILITAAIAIKLDSPGPVFFFQKRTGWEGKVFSIWKFRTMHIDKPDDGVVKQATENDPRVTRVGRILRRTSIDELPQLFNVLFGNMSLVGPRPHALQHNDFYSKKIAAYLARHRIKPGITGLAQVRGFRGETKDLHLMEERVKNDIEYINRWSLMLDISILIRTALVVASCRAY